MGGRQPRALSDPDYTLSCFLAALAIPPRNQILSGPRRVPIARRSETTLVSTDYSPPALFRINAP